MRRTALAETHKQEDVSLMCPGVKLALRFANPVMAPHNEDEFILGQFTENHNVLSVCRAGDHAAAPGQFPVPPLRRDVAPHRTHRRSEKGRALCSIMPSSSCTEGLSERK